MRGLLAVLSLFATASVCAALGAPVFSIGKHGGGHHRHGHGHRGGARAEAYAGVHALAASTKNVGVSEKNIDGHVDDLVWLGKDGEVMFLVRADGGEGRGA